MGSWVRRHFEVSHVGRRAIVPMEGIRGVAVFLVFVVHFVTLIEPWLADSSWTYEVARHIRGIGNIGVDLFFLLSGFLIYGALIRRARPFGDYLKGRIRRIYPTFSVVFGIYLALSLLRPATSKIPDGWEGGLLVLQNFVLMPGLFPVTAIITVAWSLSYEFFYYLAVPTGIALLGMRRWPSLARISFFLALSVVGFAYFANHTGPIRLLMFVPGILLFEVLDAKLIKRMPPLGMPAFLLALVVVIAFNEQGVDGWWKYLALFVLFFVFCLDCFLRPGISARLFSFRPLRWLGNMSYSYYLIHGLCLNFVFLVLSKLHPAAGADQLLFWALALPAFGLTLLPSAALFIWVEKPFSLAPAKRT